MVRSSSRRKDSHNLGKALLDACESRRTVGRRKLETGQGLYRNDRQVGPLLIWPLPPGDPVTVFGIWIDNGDAGAMLAAWHHWILSIEEALHGTRSER